MVKHDDRKFNLKGLNRINQLIEDIKLYTSSVGKINKYIFK